MDYYWQCIVKKSLVKNIDSSNVKKWFAQHSSSNRKLDSVSSKGLKDDRIVEFFLGSDLKWSCQCALSDFMQLFLLTKFSIRVFD